MQKHVKKTLAFYVVFPGFNEISQIRRESERSEEFEETQREYAE